MKFKLISLLLLAFSLQSLAMEQGNNDGHKGEENKEEKTVAIDRDKSLGKLAVFSDEILIKIILSGIENSDYKEALNYLNSLKITSKQLRALGYDSVIKQKLTPLKKKYDQLTQDLIIEFNKDPKDLKKITHLILQGADTETKNILYESTVLILAASAGHVNLVETLLNKGAEINATNTFGNTALMRAAKNGQTAIVTILLKHNANIHMRNDTKQTALMVADKKRYTEIVKLIEQHDLQQQELLRQQELKLARQQEELSLLQKKEQELLQQNTQLKNQKNSCGIL